MLDLPQTFTCEDIFDEQGEPLPPASPSIEFLVELPEAPEAPFTRRRTQQTACLTLEGTTRTNDFALTIEEATADHIKGALYSSQFGPGNTAPLTFRVLFDTALERHTAP